jgi:hypothetical protein
VKNGEAMATARFMKPTKSAKRAKSDPRIRSSSPPSGGRVNADHWAVDRETDRV